MVFDENMSAIEIFSNTSMKYERQLKRAFAKELMGRLNEHMSDDDMNDVMKQLKLRMIVPKKKVTPELKKHDDDTARADNTNKSNLLKFVIRELKENMSKSTEMRVRNKIAQQVINKINDGFSFEDSKVAIYAQYNIQITYKVGEDNNRTNLENMSIEREYDEYSGRIIYGWDDSGEALYEPTYGVVIEPPTFKNGGNRWREILEHRWEQRSWYDDDEVIDEFVG